MREVQIESLKQLQSDPLWADVNQLVCNMLPFAERHDCKTLLHIGSGDGHILLICRERGIEAAGTELHPMFLKRAQHRKLCVFPYDLRMIHKNLGDESFDCTLMIHLDGTPRNVIDDEVVECGRIGRVGSMFITNDLKFTKAQVEAALPNHDIEVRPYGYRNLNGVLAWRDLAEYEL